MFAQAGALIFYVQYTADSCDDESFRTEPGNVGSHTAGPFVESSEQERALHAERVHTGGGADHSDY